MVKEWYDKTRCIGHPKSSAPKPTSPKWCAEHRKEFPRRGLVYPVQVPLDDFKESYPGASELTAREYEVYIAQQTDISVCPCPGRWIDLSQRLERSKSNKPLGTVSPGAVYFTETQMRVITGLEKLMAQGIRYNDQRQEIIEASSDTLLGDLAGNAFAMGQVAAVQFVVDGVLSSLAQPVITYPLTGERVCAVTPGKLCIEFSDSD